MRSAPVDCDTVADLLDALADGELPPDVAAGVTAHLAGCASCAAERAAIDALRGELAGLARPEPPPALAARIRNSLPAAARAPAAPRRRVLEWAAAGVAGVALGGAAGWIGRGDAPPRDLVLHDLLAAHSRALLGAAPPQVATSDSHTVRPWLSERLPVAPRVADPPGFPLEGARLDLVDGRAVAAILHRRRQHAVTVFATAAGAEGWPRAPLTRNGFALHPWIADGVHYVAVSDLNAGELASLAGLLGSGR